MSAKATFWAWEQMIEHAPTKLVLLALADSANDENNQMSWPSVRHLAKKTGICERSVQNSLARLEALGFLKKTSLYRANGSCHSSLLQLVIPGIAVPAKSIGDNDLIECPVPGAYFTPPVHGMHPPGAPHAPTPGARRAPLESKSIESKKEPSPDKPSRKRDEIFDAIATATGIELTEINQINGSMIAKAKQQILQSTPTVTPDEIRNRAIAYRTKWPNAALTPTALAKHWPTLGTQNGSGTTKQQLLSHMP